MYNNIKISDENALQLIYTGIYIYIYILTTVSNIYEAQIYIYTSKQEAHYNIGVIYTGIYIISNYHYYI